MVPKEPVVEKDEEHEQRTDSDRIDGHESSPSAEVSSFRHRSNLARAVRVVKSYGGSVGWVSVPECTLSTLSVSGPAANQHSEHGTMSEAGTTVSKKIARRAEGEAHVHALRAAFAVQFDEATRTTSSRSRSCSACAVSTCLRRERKLHTKSPR
jgi:hypothetical protein